MTNVAEISLLEQLQFTEREIASRKALFGLGDDDAANLMFCRDWMAENSERIAQQFYRHITQSSEISLLIGDKETLERIHYSMKVYLISLFHGFFDSDYVNSRLRMGRTHKRIGVPPKLYISALWQLVSMINHSLAEMTTKFSCEHKLSALQESLYKVIMFDTQLFFDSYINSMAAEITSAKNVVQQYANDLEIQVAERTKQLHELAIKDPLTGLLNQRAFLENLRREISNARRQAAYLALVYIDLNGFKSLNDNMGHKAGDIMLQYAADCLRTRLRESDIPARYGGDEFCIIMPNTRAEDAHKVCERVIEYFDNNKTYDITFSAGIAQASPNNYLDVDDFIRHADGLMYRAKQLSRESPGHRIILDAA